MSALRDQLREQAEAFHETHISWVFLTGDTAYKVKKPVELGFLDFSTPERRRSACEAEVRLNRRLAPDVYRGVVPVTRDAAGVHRLGGDGAPVDWAVEMVRLADADRADQRLAAGTLDGPRLDRLAARMAAFHGGARSDAETAAHGTLQAIARNVEENFAQTRAAVGRSSSASEAAEVRYWQRSFLAREAARFAARVEAGRVRDGHGDLRLEHVYFRGDPERVTVIDCIEFNERFRFGDVCADVAFLAMDLTWHGRADLAERFLAAYAREADDFDLYPLVDFYESYRAYVRAKVATLLAADSGATPQARARAGTEARRSFLLALASARRPLLPPVVVAVGGTIAAGKSTLAAALAAEMAVPVVDSDRTRKHLVGVEPLQPLADPAFAGAYRPALTDRVYDEVLRRAGEVLASGRGVILDASFRSRAMQAAARRLATSHGVPFLYLECRAPPEACKARLVERARARSVSDGRLEVFEDFLARMEPVDELAPGEHQVVDTTRPLEACIGALRHRLPFWPTSRSR